MSLNLGGAESVSGVCFSFLLWHVTSTNSLHVWSCFPFHHCLFQHIGTDGMIHNRRNLLKCICTCMKGRSSKFRMWNSGQSALRLRSGSFVRTNLEKIAFILDCAFSFQWHVFTTIVFLFLVYNERVLCGLLSVLFLQCLQLYCTWHLLTFPGQETPTNLCKYSFTDQFEWKTFQQFTDVFWLKGPNPIYRGSVCAIITHYAAISWVKMTLHYPHNTWRLLEDSIFPVLFCSVVQFWTSNNFLMEK